MILSDLKDGLSIRFNKITWFIDFFLFILITVVEKCQGKLLSVKLIYWSYIHFILDTETHDKYGKKVYTDNICLYRFKCKDLKVNFDLYPFGSSDLESLIDRENNDIVCSISRVWSDEMKNISGE